MASVTKDKDPKFMTSDVPPDAEEPRDDRPSRPAGKGGFFTIHKPAQGRATRIATGCGAALLIGLTVHFLYTQVPTWFFTPAEQFPTALKVWNGIVIAAALGLTVLGWRLINKPDHAEFLIATDSEMKKVNWTSRKELWGSTKVVIGFMLFIAAVLFVVDLVFHWIFYLMSVLKFAPLGA